MCKIELENKSCAKLNEKINQVQNWMRKRITCKIEWENKSCAKLNEGAKLNEKINQVQNWMRK